MKIHREFQQKTDGQPSFEWIQARTGVITASEADALVSPLGEIRKGAMVETYLAKKLAERWTGGSTDAFSGTFNTEQGSILETEALPFAEFQYGIRAETVGFVSMDGGDVGCSPDGLIGFVHDGKDDSGEQSGWEPYIQSGIEIKCPTVETHIRYLLDGKVPKDYYAQIQFSMMVCECDTWHFLSYRRNFPALHLVVQRDEKFQDALREAIDKFLVRLRKGMERMIELNGGEPSPKHRGLVPFKLPAVKTNNQNEDIIP